MSNPISSAILNFASKLRFPTLFAIVAGLFAIDLIIPDFIPFLDELLLGMGALLFGAWKKRKQSAQVIEADK